jgi:pyridoxine 5'-phosphate synthase PdxJ
LACLSIKDEISLKELIKKAESKNIKYSVFIEPDIDNQITSVAFEPSDATRRLTSSLPKMLKNK